MDDRVLPSGGRWESSLDAVRRNGAIGETPGLMTARGLHEF
jgi:hypothetical protein